MQDKYILHTALALWSVVLGAFLCAVYDVFRLFRLRRKQNAVTLFICDVLFCVISALSLLILFFNLSHGRMRAYAFVLCLGGLLIWRLTVSRFVMALMGKLIDFVSRLLHSLKAKIIFVYKRIARYAYTSAYCRKTVLNLKNLKFKRKEEKNDTEEARTG